MQTRALNYANASRVSVASGILNNDPDISKVDEGKGVKDPKARKHESTRKSTIYNGVYTQRPYIRPRYPRRLSHELPATRSPRTRVYLWWLPTTGGSATVHADSARSILDDGSPSKAFHV